jgi:hypothetical protein
MTAVKLLQQQTEDRRAARDVQLNGMKATLDDHEGRLRTLERAPRL